MNNNKRNLDNISNNNTTAINDFKTVTSILLMDKKTRKSVNRLIVDIIIP